MSMFTISIVIAGICLLVGVLAIVRGKALAGFLAIILAIAIAAFGYREDVLEQDDDPTPTPEVTIEATPAS